MEFPHSVSIAPSGQFHRAGMPYNTRSGARAPGPANLNLSTADTIAGAVRGSAGILARLPSPVFDNRARGGDYLYAAHGGLEHSLLAPDRRRTVGS